MVRVNIISANCGKEHALYRCHGETAWVSLTAAIAVLEHRDGSVIVFPNGTDWLLVSATPAQLMSGRTEWDAVLDELERDDR